MMPLQNLPTTITPPINDPNCHPMLYYAQPNLYQYPQQQHYYDPATASLIAMPTLIPEQQPLYYTIDQYGNYILLTPAAPAINHPPIQLSSPDQSFVGSCSGAESNHVLLPTPHSSNDGIIVSSPQPSDPSPSYYDPIYSNNNNNMSYGNHNFDANKPRIRPDKTMMCKMFSTNGTCSYGTACRYAHCEEEIRSFPLHPKYKTEPCNKYYTSGGCPYGNKCLFRHGDDHNTTTSSNESHQRKDQIDGKKKKKNGQRITADSSLSPSSPTSMGDSAPSNMSPSDEKKKEKRVIKPSLYHRLEKYVGKNRNPRNLKRSNSCHTVGTFTLQRFIKMEEIVKTQVNKNQSNHGKRYLKKQQL